MKHIAIYTIRYKNELENFMTNAKKNNFCITNKKQDTSNVIPSKASCFFMKLAWEKSVADKITQELIHMLYHIVTNENPVYKYSPKLKDLSTSLHNTPQYENDVEQLKSFLHSSKELNIDGYVTFRMDEYKEKLDMMLYKIVKKINFGK